MSALLPAVLAAAAVACLLWLPTPASLRLDGVVPGQQPAVPTSLGPGLPTLAAVGVAVGVAVGWAVAWTVGWTAGGVPALLTVAGVVAVRRVRRRRSVAAARTSERARAVEACAVLAAELRAGRAPADALHAAAEVATGPCGAVLAAAAGAARLGGDVAAALRPPSSTAVPDVLRSLAACWTVCAATGSGLAAAVERLEEGLRADQSQRRAVAAELAGPRATAGLLAVLPAGGLLMAGGLGADPLHVLLSTPVGLVCLTAGLLLDAAGLWWTGRLVDRAGGG